MATQIIGPSSLVTFVLSSLYISTLQALVVPDEEPNDPGGFSQQTIAIHVQTTLSLFLPPPEDHPPSAGNKK